MSLTNTGRGSEVSFVSHVTVTAEGSDCVDALTVTAQVWQHLALVDIWKNRNILRRSNSCTHEPLWTFSQCVNLDLIYFIRTKFVVNSEENR